MTPSQTQVRDHYQAALADETELIARLTEDPEDLSAERLAALDQFHVGGLGATDELARRAQIAPGTRVLDAGSGLGGPARRLAQTYGAIVTGVDLAPAYVAVAQALARRAGLADVVSFQVGSITAMPFADATFDVVWTQHVAMNIPDRAGLYREFRRVLRAGGRLAFYDPYLPETGAPPIYPTPWAASAAASTLLSKANTIERLVDAGFAIEMWADVTADAARWSAPQQQLIEPTASAPVLNLGLAMGPRIREMVMNFQRNLQEGRLHLGMGLGVAV